MNEKDKFYLDVIKALLSNPEYYHDVVAPHNDLAMTVKKDAKKITDEVFKQNVSFPD